MPHSTTTATKRPRPPRAFSERNHQKKANRAIPLGWILALFVEWSVGLVSRSSGAVSPACYAQKADMSMSKAIATLGGLASRVRPTESARFQQAEAESCQRRPEAAG